MDYKINLITRVTKRLSNRKLARVIKKEPIVLDYLTGISLSRISNTSRIEVSNPRDIRDMIELYLEEKDVERCKELLSIVYFQIKGVVTSGVDESLIKDFFEEIIHVEFEDGCDKLNLFEYSVHLYNGSSKWYALMCVYLSEICAPWSHYISSCLFNSKPGTKKRIRNLYKVFHLGYYLRDKFTSPAKYEYVMGVPLPNLIRIKSYPRQKFLEVPRV